MQTWKVGRNPNTVRRVVAGFGSLRIRVVCFHTHQSCYYTQCHDVVVAAALQGVLEERVMRTIDDCQASNPWSLPRLVHYVVDSGPGDYESSSFGPPLLSVKSLLLDKITTE